MIEPQLRFYNFVEPFIKQAAAVSTAARTGPYDEAYTTRTLNSALVFHVAISVASKIRHLDGTGELKLAFDPVMLLHFMDATRILSDLEHTNPELLHQVRDELLSILLDLEPEFDLALLNLKEA